MDQARCAADCVRWLAQRGYLLAAATLTALFLAVTGHLPVSPLSWLSLYLGVAALTGGPMLDLMLARRATVTATRAITRIAAGSASPDVHACADRALTQVRADATEPRLRDLWRGNRAR